MIELHYGNMLDVKEGILVHGCNCQGAMGSGIAGQIREKWPQVYEDYMKRYTAEGLQLGSVIYTEVATKYGDTIKGPIELGPQVIVASGLTQFNYGGDPDVVYVDYDAISAVFSQIKVLAKREVLEIHFPLIGCGLANGDWAEVSKRIDAALDPDIKAHLWVLPPKNLNQIKGYKNEI